jgi:hypothetical protein
MFALLLAKITNSLGNSATKGCSPRNCYVYWNSTIRQISLMPSSRNFSISSHGSNQLSTAALNRAFFSRLGTVNDIWLFYFIFFNTVLLHSPNNRDGPIHSRISIKSNVPMSFYDLELIKTHLFDIIDSFHHLDFSFHLRVPFTVRMTTISPFLSIQSTFQGNIDLRVIMDYGA